jgi:hypothetical protein
VNGLKAIGAIDPALEKWFTANGWTVTVSKTYDERGERLPYLLLYSCYYFFCGRFDAFQAQHLDHRATCPVGLRTTRMCLSGNEVKSVLTDHDKSLKKYGKQSTFLGWYEIQSAFYRALPPDTVVFNSRYAEACHHKHILSFSVCQMLQGGMHILTHKQKNHSPT